MPRINAVHGDITRQTVHAIVNAANNAMRGGGGVNGAIHLAVGPAILRDCEDLFPHGLATGDAGFTTAGDLPARWVIHTVGPNYAADQQDRSQLHSSYRRALAVADELGATAIAFPLSGTGAYGWPLVDGVRLAVATAVREVRLVTVDADGAALIETRLPVLTHIRILQGVRALHELGYHQVRAVCGIGGPGYWRVSITTADNIVGRFMLRDEEIAIRYSAADLTRFAGGEVTASTRPPDVADLIRNLLAEVRTGLPPLSPAGCDPGYAAWFVGLMWLVERQGMPPVSYCEWFDDSQGWEVSRDGGGGGDVRYPHPPPFSAEVSEMCRQRLS